MEISTEIEILHQSDEIVITKFGNKVRIKIEHQLMQILMLLTEFEGRLVEKQLFIDRIWHGNQLTGDNALTKNIFKLREIFKINGIDPWFQIETIPKKGYRLLRTGQESMAFEKKRVVMPYTWILLLAFAVFLKVSYLKWLAGDGNDLNSIITVNGKDTVIQFGNKKVQIIQPDTATTKIIPFDSLKNK